MSTGLIFRAKTGEKTKIYISPSKILIDSHMHIQSSHCTPLPLLWAQNVYFIMDEPMSRQEIQDNITIKKRSIIPKLVMPGAVKAAKISYEPTYLIGGKVVSLASQVTADARTFGRVAALPLVVMPMDMEYAHLAGYQGIPIYTIDKDDNYKWMKREWFDEGDLKKLGPGKTVTGIKKKYQPAFGITKLGSLRFELDKNFHLHSYVNAYEVTSYEDIPSENSEVYHDWEKQLNQTEMAVVRHPWKLLPMYHYEPRRYTPQAVTIAKQRPTKKQNSPSNWIRQLANWKDPFQQLATASNKGLYLGFKMYCSLGYQPKDPEIGFLNDLGFYRECAGKKIPILVHNTPGGMTTHELEFYAYHMGHPGTGDVKKPERKAADFFFENYVHPDAWDKVLSQVPDLSLCLAHFGGTEMWKLHKKTSLFNTAKAWEKNWIERIIAMTGKYPNLYTDVSYLFAGKLDKKAADAFQDPPQGASAQLGAMDALQGGTMGKFMRELVANPHLRDKVLFGTDWFLSEMDEIGIAGYCRQVKVLCDNLSDQVGEDTWEKFTVINPLKFYGLDNEQKLANMKDAMHSRLAAHFEELSDQEASLSQKKLAIEIDIGFDTLKKIINRTMRMAAKRETS